MSKGKIEVPSLSYYGMIHLKALWRALNTQSLWFLGHTYQVKALGITFSVYTQTYLELEFWMILFRHDHCAVTQIGSNSYRFYLQLPLKLRHSGQAIVRWLSSDCPLTVCWLSADYMLTVSWLSADCPMTVRWLSNDWCFYPTISKDSAFKAL